MTSSMPSGPRSLLERKYIKFKVQQLCARLKGQSILAFIIVLPDSWDWGFFFNLNVSLDVNIYSNVNICS